MKISKRWIVLLGLLSSLSSLAASDKYECKISKRLDKSSKVWSDEFNKDVSITGYEDVNGFIFEDYPWLLITPVTSGWEVSVGAMSYGDGGFSSSPKTISKTWDNGFFIFSYNNPEGDNKWHVRINMKTLVAKLTYEDDSIKLIDTAEFACK